MHQDTTQIMNFWYEFDKFFLSREMQAVMGPLSPYGKLRNSFLYHYDKGSLETGFKSDHENIKDSIKILSDNQRRIMEEHFGGNTKLEQMAFELFAQGFYVQPVLVPFCFVAVCSMSNFITSPILLY